MKIEYTEIAKSFTNLFGIRRNFAVIFSTSKRTKKSAMTPFYLLLFSRYRSPKMKAFDIHKKYKYERKFIFVVYSFFLHYTCSVSKISELYLHYYFLSEFSKFFIEIILRFKCLMVEFKCLLSRVIALNTSAQVNKWNLPFCFLDFRIIFFGKYFFEFFSRSLRSKSPIFLFGDQKEF